MTRAGRNQKYRLITQALCFLLLKILQENYYKLNAICSDKHQINRPINHQKHSRLLLLDSFNRIRSMKIRVFKYVDDTSNNIESL